MNPAPVETATAEAMSSADAACPAQQQRDFPRPDLAAGRLDVRGARLSEATLAALFPEAVAAGPVVGLAAWRLARGRRRMRAHAAALGVPFLALDRGLLRAPPGYRRASAILGVTAVATVGPSSAADILSPDRVLASRGWETPALINRAAAARRDLVSRRVGGTWWRPRVLPGGERIALLDAGATGSPRFESAFSAMLAAALAQHPTDKVVVLAGAAFRGSRKLRRIAAGRGCQIVTGTVDPWAAVERAERVYTLGGEVGFLALLAGHDVACFDDAFYSGWGVTGDGPGVAQRPFRRGRDEIFAGACLVATRHVDPFRQTPASFEDIASILADWRKIDESNRRIAVCVGMSFWKRRRVADFLRSSVGTPVFRRTAGRALAAAGARPGDGVAVWASRVPEGLVAAAQRQHIPLIWVEDGFVRSVGLGSDFVPAASLVLDGRGMHYDPRVSSDLRQLLLETEFDERLIARARSLIARLVVHGITKYNQGAATVSLDLPRDRPRILVPGQVEDDLSVLRNSAEIRGNLDLLKRVRAANPDAFILYKPHPDVDAGHRTGAIPDAVANSVADAVVRGVSTAALLGEVDELHTLSSLAGFEALLRRRRVVVYGRPFYAGWGLTIDLAGTDRAATGRGRWLSLEELVAGALILYPRYLDPLTRLPCPPEVVIERLEDPRLWRPGPLVVARRVQGLAARYRSELAGHLRILARVAGK